MHRPVFAFFVLHLHVARSKVKRDASVEAVIVEKVALDYVAPVAEGDEELLESVVGVMFQDVPEDRVSSDFDHRLGFDFGLFCQTGTEAAG